MALYHAPTDICDAMMEIFFPNLGGYLILRGYLHNIKCKLMFCIINGEGRCFGWDSAKELLSGL